jgi:hypothetical protein
MTDMKMPTRPHGTGMRGVTVVLLALVVAAAIVVGVRWIAAPKLSGGANGNGTCKWMTSTAETQQTLANGVLFGMDTYRLPTSRARITVTRVRLVGVTGGLYLRQAAFVPHGGVGVGPIWDVGSQLPARSASNGAAVLARGLPATLSFQPRPPDGDPDWDGRSWQLAIGLSFSPDSQGGSATGVEISYTSGLRTVHQVNHTDIGVYRSSSGCGSDKKA